jgi:hypothetical protein
MDVAEVYDWFAQESRLAAEQTNEPRQREMFLRLALMWATAHNRVVAPTKHGRNGRRRRSLPHQHRVDGRRRERHAAFVHDAALASRMSRSGR